RLGVESGEEQPLVAVELRHRLETPALALQFAVIGFLEPRHADQPPVVAVGPAMIGAGEARGIAGISTAQPVAAMAADIQEGVHLARAVAHHENRVFAHIGRKEITGLRDLAFMAQEKPTAGEDPLLLLLIDLGLDVDAAADQSTIGIDETSKIC